MLKFILLLMFCLSVNANELTLFKSGENNTHTYRIPAIVTALNGDLIAACDARIENSRDLIWSQDIHIVIKRSSDNGKTWTPVETVSDFGHGKPASDPSFILDRSNGDIYCFYNFMDQKNAPKKFRLYYQKSSDHGKTWSGARDITKDITPANWENNFMFITSGRGIQTSKGEFLHTLVNLKTKGLYLFGSRDHGKTWELKPAKISPADESKIVELSDGTLLINSRVNGSGFRWFHESKDDGLNWTSYKKDSLIDPSCNASIISYTSIKDGFSKNRLLFSNCDSSKGRKNLTIKISYDDGKSWSKGFVVEKGSAAYSSMTVCKDGSIGILYETKGYKEISFKRISLEEITNGKDSLQKPFLINKNL